MYGELGSIKGLVDLSPEHALDEAEAFLATLGYSILRRTSTTLTGERRSSDQPAGQDVPNLTVVAMPQPQGGVQIKIRGNDFEGVQARRADWMGWSEGLPRKATGVADAPADEQGRMQTPDVDLPPPPSVESPTLPPPASTADVPVPPPPQQRSWETATPLPQQAASQEGWRQRHPLLTGGLAIIVLLFVLGVVTSAFGNGGGGSGNAGDGGGSGGIVKDEGSGETFTRQNYGVLVANPNEHVGAKVDVTGQLLVAISGRTLDDPSTDARQASMPYPRNLTLLFRAGVRTVRSATRFSRPAPTDSRIDTC